MKPQSALSGQLPAMDVQRDGMSDLVFVPVLQSSIQVLLFAFFISTLLN